MDNPLAQDLDHILAHTQGLWEELRGERIFITGGTGFFGCWLLESFLWANDRLDLNASICVLTRNPDAFKEKVPHLASHAAVDLLTGDVRSFGFPSGNFSHIIHAATEASVKLNQEEPTLMLDTIIEGTRHALEFARHCNASKFLLTSSGAVYGKQPSDVTHIDEDYPGSPDTMAADAAYGEGKRVAEFFSAFYARRYGFEAKIARCFAFIGPYLPLDAHFAAGNFVGDALKGGPIRVNGDGTPFRSYLYAADLAIWLWTILFRGKTCRTYNVGSEVSTSIADLARITAGICGQDVLIAELPMPGKPAARYVPSTQRILKELGLKETIGLESAVAKTICWHSRSNK